MTRSDSDTWDLASSVGATATMVAAARALATEDADPIINDPFAAPLVRAVGIDFFTRVVDGKFNAADAGETGDGELQTETDSLAVRTRFFDDFFTNAAAAGIGQAVILAAGLDARAYRLAWPSGTVVYEVDQPKVVEFKTETMARLGAEPTAERRTVSIDLRDDWPTALRESGFDTTQPSAWSAEGLLMYLPPEAQDRLFDHITALSAPGSQLATEYHPDGGPIDGRTRQGDERPVGQTGLRRRFVGAVLRRRAQQRRRVPQRSGMAGRRPRATGAVRRLRSHLPHRRRNGRLPQHRRGHRHPQLAERRPSAQLEKPGVAVLHRARPGGIGLHDALGGRPSRRVVIDDSRPTAIRARKAAPSAAPSATFDTSTGRPVASAMARSHGSTRVPPPAATIRDASPRSAR